MAFTSTRRGHAREVHRRCFQRFMNWRWFLSFASTNSKPVVLIDFMIKQALKPKPPPSTPTDASLFECKSNKNGEGDKNYMRCSRSSLSSSILKVSKVFNWIWCTFSYSILRIHNEIFSTEQKLQFLECFSIFLALHENIKWKCGILCDFFMWNIRWVPSCFKLRQQHHQEIIVDHRNIFNYQTNFQSDF